MVEFVRGFVKIWLHGQAYFAVVVVPIEMKFYIFLPSKSTVTSLCLLTAAIRWSRQSFFVYLMKNHQQIQIVSHLFYASTVWVLLHFESNRLCLTIFPVHCDPVIMLVVIHTFLWWLPCFPIHSVWPFLSSYTLRCSHQEYLCSDFFAYSGHSRRSWGRSWCLHWWIMHPTLKWQCWDYFNQQ